MKIIFKIILIASIYSCFDLQIRKSDLDIKKSNEANGYLKISFKGDRGSRTPVLTINLTEHFPKVKRQIPIIYLEDRDTVYSLEGRVESQEIIIPIKQGEYYASIANEKLFGSNAFFIFPLFFQEDKYIGMSFGFDEKYDLKNYSMDSLQSGKCKNHILERPVSLWWFVPGDIAFNYCPKLKITPDKITEIEITFTEERLEGWRSFYNVVPGIFLGLPLFGTLVYKSDSTVEIKYPNDSFMNNSSNRVNTNKTKDK